MLYAIVAALVIILDQWVKYWVQNNIVLNMGSKELIPGILSLVNLHNDGAAFSFLSGSGARIWFIALTGAFTLLVLIALATRLISGKVGRWSAVLVVAGGLSNCIDRIIYGYVQDMFRIDLFDFAVFNVADIFITLFCFIFIIYVFVGERKTDESDYDDEDFEDEDDYDDYYDEPKRKKKMSRRAARKVAAIRDDEDDEDDYEEEEPKPKKSSKKSRKSKYDEDYEDYKAKQSSRSRKQETYDEEARPAPARKAAAAVPVRRTSSSEVASDPFAEWDNANRRSSASSQRSVASAAKPAANAKPVVASQANAQPAQRPVASATTAKPATRTPAPSASRPVAQTAPKPASVAKSSEDEFNLDDILAEFK